jgi:hypothetical protein
MSECHYFYYLNIRATVAIETGTFRLDYYANGGLKVRRFTFQLAN